MTMTEGVAIDWEPQLEDGAEEEQVRRMWNDSSVHIAVAIVTASFVISFVWRKVRASLERKNPFPNLPSPPGSHWLLGSAVHVGGTDFIPGYEHLFQNHANEHGQTGFFILNEAVVGVTHWEDAVAICNAEINRQTYSAVRKHTSMVLGQESFMLMNGKKWRRRHATIKKALAPAAVQQSRETKVKVITTMVESIQKRLEDSGQDRLKLELGELMTLYTMDVFGEVAFSIELKSCEKLKPSPFGKAFDLLGIEWLRRCFSLPTPANFFYSIPTAANLEHQKQRMILRTFLATLLSRRKKAMQNDKLTDNEKEDLLTFYLKQQAEIEEKVDGDSMSDEALQDNLLGILFAGYDTTSVALTYAICLLSTSDNPEIEQNVVKEAGAAKSIADISDLCYCRGVFMEALRLYGPATMTGRRMQKDVTLKGGFVVPKGTFVLLPIWSINHCEHNFPRPDEFLPERWAHWHELEGKWKERTEADENSDVPMGNRNALFSFTAGGRSCPGRQFAMQEGVIGLAALMKDLEFSFASDYKLKPTQLGFVQGPKGGLPVDIKKRA